MAKSKDPAAALGVGGAIPDVAEAIPDVVGAMGGVCVRNVAVVGREASKAGRGGVPGVGASVEEDGVTAALGGVGLGVASPADVGPRADVDYTHRLTC